MLKESSFVFVFVFVSSLVYNWKFDTQIHFWIDVELNMIVTCGYGFGVCHLSTRASRFSHVYVLSLVELFLGKNHDNMVYRHDRT